MIARAKRRSSNKREGGQDDFDDRFFKTEARDKEVDADRRGLGSDLQIGKKDDAEMDRMDAIGAGNGCDEGNDDGHGRKDVHQAPNDQKKKIQHDQERKGAGDMAFDEIKHLHGDFFVDQVIRQAHGRTQNDQNPADQDDAFSHDLRKVPPFDIPVNDHLDEKNINGRDRSRLADRKISAVDSPNHNEGKRKFPDHLPRWHDHTQWPERSPRHLSPDRLYGC